MHGTLSKLFHLKLREAFAKLSIPHDYSQWPDEWKRITYKTYERMPQTHLPVPAELSGNIGTIIEKRRSTRRFKHEPITLEQLSQILHRAGGIRTSNHLDGDRLLRRYPSGGARYPLELYVVARSVTELEKGLYHYNVKQHVLEQLGDGGLASSVQKSAATVYQWVGDAAAVIIITAVWDRNFIKYQDFGYKVVLMEAGHLSQNVQLVSEALGLAYCSLVGFNEAAVDELLDVGEKRGEHSLYMTAIGTRVE